MSEEKRELQKEESKENQGREINNEDKKREGRTGKNVKAGRKKKRQGKTSIVKRE